MVTTLVQRRLTCDEFDEIPEPDDGRRLELDEGKVITRMVVGLPHGRIAVRVGAALDAFATRHRLGAVAAETGYRLRDTGEKGTVPGPDVSFIDNERLQHATQSGSVRAAPNLAVEVLAPGDRRGEVERKVRQYLDAATARVWVVRPGERTITVYLPEAVPVVFGEEDTLESGEAGFVVEGFEIKLGELFAGVQ